MKHENLGRALRILDKLESIRTPKFKKLLFFYHVNAMDEVNSETKLIKHEVATGMTDPVRAAAIIELQNFIKKNVGKKVVMKKIAGDSTESMMVKTNKCMLKEIGITSSRFSN